MANGMCTFTGCGRPERSRGLCWTHRRQAATGVPLADIRPWRSQGQRDEQGRKLCRACLEWLPEGSFGKSARNTDGINYQCKQCATDRHRLRQYGITMEQYDVLVIKQGGGCAICGERCSSGRRLAVDHDHSCCSGSETCGKCVRGLLCGSCNLGIGKFKDSPRLLVSAIAYLA